MSRMETIVVAGEVEVVAEEGLELVVTRLLMRLFFEIFTMRFAVCISLFISMFVGILCKSASAQIFWNPKTEFAAKLCAVFSVPFTNAEALTSGDVLFVEELLFDNVQLEAELTAGALVSEKHFTRIAFDYSESPRYACYRVKKTKVVDFEGHGNPATRETIEWCAASYNGATKTLESIESTRHDKYSITPTEYKNALAGAGFGCYRDLRCIWLGDGFSVTDDPKSLAGRYERIRLGENFHSKTDAGDKFTLTFKLPYKGKSEGFQGPLTIFNEYTFDKESSMLNRREEFASDITQRYPGRKVLADWALINEIYVPLTLHVEKGERLEINGIVQRANVDRDYKFHWFSVNESLPDSLFDGTNLSDEKAVYDMTDPKKTGATTLLHQDPVKNGGSNKSPQTK